MVVYVMLKDSTAIDLMYKFITGILFFKTKLYDGVVKEL